MNGIVSFHTLPVERLIGSVRRECLDHSLITPDLEKNQRNRGLRSVPQSEKVLGIEPTSEAWGGCSYSGKFFTTKPESLLRGGLFVQVAGRDSPFDHLSSVGASISAPT